MRLANSDLFHWSEFEKTMMDLLTASSHTIRHTILISKLALTSVDAILIDSTIGPPLLI